MKFTFPLSTLRRAGLVVCLLAGVTTLRALDSAKLGLEPVYAQLHPERTKVLNAEELAAALAQLPGW